MLKVNIINQNENKSWSASFPTEQEAQAWLNSQIGKPHRLPEREIPTYDENGAPIIDENGDPVMETLPAEFTSEIIDISAEVSLANAKAEAQKYLDETDWYVIRKYERNVDVPEGVTTARLNAISILNS